MSPTLDDLQRDHERVLQLLRQTMEVVSTQSFILREATAGEDLGGLLAATCERLVAAGVPLWRVSLNMPAIDPTVRTLAFVWRRGWGTSADTSPHGDKGEAIYHRSPIHHLQAAGLDSGRWQVETGEGCDTLPLLAELRAEGATDYLLRIVHFGGS